MAVTMPSHALVVHALLLRISRDRPDSNVDLMRSKRLQLNIMLFKILLGLCLLSELATAHDADVWALETTVATSTTEITATTSTTETTVTTSTAEITVTTSVTEADLTTSMTALTLNTSVVSFPAITLTTTVNGTTMTWLSPIQTTQDSCTTASAKPTPTDTVSI
jgi:hypothetical protein